MKRSKYYKILATMCWIILILDIILNKHYYWYNYVSIICCIFVILITSYKTYKRKFIALCLLVFYKLYYTPTLGVDGFCNLINYKFSIKYLKYIKKIEYIKPIISIEDPFYFTNDYRVGFWFKRNDWETRINYLKTILKE